MRVYLRLLQYLRPYRLRLLSAIGCMVLYAAMSAVSLGFVAPFMRVLFERAPAASTAVERADAPPGPAAGGSSASEGSARLIGWPAPLREWASRTLLNARPLVALERICLLSWSRCS
jgi:hypothetical protein